MARGIPIAFDQLPKTQTNLGQFQKAEGLRGMNTDLSRSISSAGNTATIDPRGFIVSEQAVGNIGAAVAGQGGALMDLVLKQNEAVNIRKEQEAMLAMELSQQEITAAMQQEPDETKWGAIAQDHIKRLDSSLFKQDLSPDAKAAITDRFSMWKERQNRGVTITSARRSFERVGEESEGAMIRAVDEKDFTKAQAIAQQMKKAGYWSDDKLAQMEGELARRAEKNKVSEAYDFALANPDAVLATPDMFTGHLPPQDRETILNRARQSQRQARSDSADALSDRLASGEFRTLTDLQQAFPVNMTPTVRKQFEGAFTRAQQPGIKAQLEADAPQNFARLSDVVEKYDAKDDPEGVRYAQIVMTIRQALPEELRGELTEPLNRKRPGTEDSIKPPEPLKETVRDIIGTMFEAGAFGKFKHEEVRKDADGTPRPDLLPKEVVDDKVKAAAYAQKGKVMIYMSKWMAENPTETPEKAHEVLRGLLSGSAPPIRSTVPRPRAAQEKPKRTATNIPGIMDWDQGDLPESGAANETNLLIPQSAPPDLQFNP